ncbi:MAG: calcium-binding protein [Roseibium sp.]|uniref:calcium-binding protein n=1 Tax=Roseibium sp. TaxID=1936156 RepID=UPI00329A3E67
MDHNQAPDIIGTPEDDVLISEDLPHQRLLGRGGDDEIFVGANGGGGFGGGGNDTIHGGGDGINQAHIYGGNGDDTMILNPSNLSAPHGEHAFGGMGSDKFVFQNVNDGDQRILGRIDDFDHTMDEIWIDDEKIDLRNPPENVRIIEYKEQPWILINERILYALEGSRIVPEEGRYGGDEVHFNDWPEEWADGVPASADMEYTRIDNFFPMNKHVTPEGGLRNQSRNTEGTSDNDNLYTGDKANVIRSKDGDDLINAGKGHDRIYGGNGDDSISAGLDRDLAYGGRGDDMIYGGSGMDTLHGDTGNDSIFGGRADDILTGGDGDDSLIGQDGNDTIAGGAGSDRIDGGHGDDVLMAGDPRETSAPSGSEDTSVNIMTGGTGDDVFFGAEGERSVMTGGSGSNTFVAAAGGEIVIMDFKAGDTLNLAERLSGDQRVTDIARTEEVDGGASDLIFDLDEATSVRLVGMGSMDVDDMLEDIVTQGPAPDPETYLEFADGITEDHPDYELHSPFLVGGDAISVYDPEIHGSGDNDDEDEEPENDEEDTSASDGTCFVATASFGEARHPDVTWLRNWRDEVLVRHPLGRAFIRAYWRFGPTLAAKVSYEGASGRVARRAITALVRTLKG